MKVRGKGWSSSMSKVRYKRKSANVDDLWQCNLESDGLCAPISQTLYGAARSSRRQDLPRSTSHKHTAGESWKYHRDDRRIWKSIGWNGKFDNSYGNSNLSLSMPWKHLTSTPQERFDFLLSQQTLVSEKLRAPIVPHSHFCGPECSCHKGEWAGWTAPWVTHTSFHGWYYIYGYISPENDREAVAAEAICWLDWYGD